MTVFLLYMLRGKSIVSIFLLCWRHELQPDSDNIEIWLLTFLQTIFDFISHKSDWRSFNKKVAYIPHIISRSSPFFPSTRAISRIRRCPIQMLIYSEEFNLAHSVLEMKEDKGWGNDDLIFRSHPRSRIVDTGLY